MSEQLWRQTTDNPNVTAILQSLVGIGYLVPVAAGALLIEDGIEAAAVRLQAEAWRLADDTEDYGASLAWAKDLLRAACGEGDR